MKNLFLSLLMITTVAVLGCSSQVKIGNATAKSNNRNESNVNKSAPMVHTVSSYFDRMVVIRLKHGTDLLDGLQKAVKKEHIKNAVILSGIGSLTSYHVHVVDSTTFPPAEVFPKADTPQDLLNVNGYVIDGRVHAHITFSDEEKGLGGHLEPGTKVFTFAIITLGILEDGVSLVRFDDWKW